MLLLLVEFVDALLPGDTAFTLKNKVAYPIGFPNIRKDTSNNFASYYFRIFILHQEI